MKPASYLVWGFLGPVRPSDKRRIMNLEEFLGLQVKERTLRLFRAFCILELPCCEWCHPHSIPPGPGRFRTGAIFPFGRAATGRRPPRSEDCSEVYTIDRIEGSADVCVGPHQYLLGIGGVPDDLPAVGALIRPRRLNEAQTAKANAPGAADYVKPKHC
ncbi:hypothetical protein JOF47_001255 [Paeniglutamicibacter kerguelensis]|uniref:Uncharacterized protein n=1 Tax=Paeniglutamicibacter kerguelensis TaxID=254788 RepID=A0ABS4XBB3_9MICC|nr:hypothetical protein [Paeniglutamicibacter kerguelensis]